MRAWLGRNEAPPVGFVRARFDQAQDGFVSPPGEWHHHEELVRLRERFNGIASRLEGKYDGWGTEVVK